MVRGHTCNMRFTNRYPQATNYGMSVIANYN